ncbi:hypothetical protein VP1G_00289 [Cytospora mali]|uniref:Uncharacterized protein n=1 Tax=Cytospora mali TaxID=578113 RepID=A0A194UMA7_CYTMA|nr:hypothetical protein VP1G_00289 [Valsa mali var. pyri (nom. inval.)]
MATTTAIYTATAACTAFNHQSYPLYPHPAIHGFNVPPGVYISPPDQYEALLGRKLSPTPSRLTSRTLYLPPHNDKATHLPIYDFTKEFKDTIRGEPIGSSRFKTNFGLMKKPVGDGRGASQVSYLVDFEALEARSLPLTPPSSPARRKSSSAASSLGRLVPTHATVRRRMLYGDAEVGLTIPPRLAPDFAMEDGDVACIITPRSTGEGIELVTSYPLRPTVSKFGSSRNPWFTFTVPSLLDDDRTLQWQIHPVEHGLLRYTLVELPRRAAVDDDRWWEDSKEVDGWGGETKRTRKSRDSDEEKPPYCASERKNEHLIRAIYHNVGLGFCLSQPFSEGALLLQNDLDPEFEAIIVASLLGLLWRARGEESKPRKNSRSEGSTPARKKSVSAGSNEKEGWSSTESSPNKKGLFGKILRRIS